MLSKIGILSDTHGLLRPEVVSAISDCKIIIHAGDIGDPGVLEALEKIAPVHAVKGNTDIGKWAEKFPLTDLIEVDGYFIYIIHEIEHLDLDPSAAKIDMVVFGHSHVAELKKKSSVLYLNPGSAGPRRFSFPVTIANVRVNSDGLIPEIIRLNV